MKELVAEVRELIRTARGAVVRTVDLIQVLTNFEIGRRIVEHEQGGEKRAGYGQEVLKELSAALTKEFGRGFSRTNLQHMRNFYSSYRERLPEKCRTVSGIFESRAIEQLPPPGKSRTSSAGSESEEISQRLSAESFPFRLSWSQYVFLTGIENPEERDFYEIESAGGGWSLRELKRQYDSGLYERLALSRDKEGIRRLAAEGQTVTGPEDLLKEVME